MLIEKVFYQSSRIKFFYANYDQWIGRYIDYNNNCVYYAAFCIVLKIKNKQMKKQKTTPEWRLNRFTTIVKIVIALIVLTSIIIALC